MTSSVFAFFGFPFRYYACWWSFSRLGSTTLVLVYFFVAGAGGGFLGWLLGRAANLHPTSSLAADGIFYGLAGAIALRADFGPRKRRSPTDRTDPVLQDVRSILGFAVTWVEKALDDLTEMKAGNWLNRMTDENLSEQANAIQSRIKGRSDVPAKAKKQMRERLVSSLESLGSANGAEARGDIVWFCAEYYSTSHIPRLESRLRPQSRRVSTTA
ncbi:hypothetical protein PHK61_12805 [Actinomycetospora lutea]|uniref:hypothetical protein n=1 Tax=Actinomycetospora lutea TaxID=663604 RepID=UPI0023652DCD|nr:hypothetical protein [Actinomycetospora lutea]MDD7939296.1 hypothetical protein [Actinomycetospora lutea]